MSMIRFEQTINMNRYYFINRVNSIARTCPFAHFYCKTLREKKHRLIFFFTSSSSSFSAQKIVKFSIVHPETDNR